MPVDHIIDLLISNNLIDPQRKNHFIRLAKESDKDISYLIEEWGITSRENLFKLISKDVNINFYNLEDFKPNQEVLNLIPLNYVKMYDVLPIHKSEKGIEVAFKNPFDIHNINELSFSINQPIIPAIAYPEQITSLIDKYYLNSNATELPKLDFSETLLDDDINTQLDSAPIIKYVDLVLIQAIKEKASDIHFEPFENDFKIRYRVDGTLYEMAPPPQHLKDVVISRVKVISDLNIAETRLPQDGRVSKEINGSIIDMRVSTIPTMFGESVVLRILDQSNTNLKLESLNIPQDVFSGITETIKKPNGIFVCTGPTGAGKTTTLYACLQAINKEDSKILTIEDPVEYEIDGIMQVSINESIDLDFKRALRSFLRQDPDSILIGEMRDIETAQIAIQASLTGHLVLSTLHTNDSAGAITRLIDMGCEPFLISSTLEAVLAQRLLRRICNNCKTTSTITDDVLAKFNIRRELLSNNNFFTGQGCDNCHNTGYNGRQGIFELLNITNSISELIREKAPAIAIKKEAQKLGMKTLKEDGLRNVLSGITSIEEVIKYT